MPSVGIFRSYIYLKSKLSSLNKPIHYFNKRTALPTPTIHNNRISKYDIMPICESKMKNRCSSSTELAYAKKCSAKINKHFTV